ncbi:hypothetical protein [Streptomyces sp. NPDC046942]|uniref:hypothetical protein n=1 Tax=Streptomyces sp. NPDC046942 TaxID=3155137 RepID=UPI0033D7BF71
MPTESDSRRPPGVGRFSIATSDRKLHESGRYRDTAMSVVFGDPIPCIAVAVNITHLRVDRFEGAKRLGPVDAAAMARVEQALSAVQDL